MSNPEKDPQPTVCRPEPAPTRGGLRSGVVVADGENGPVEILEPRDVPLGGPRGMTVRRTLPQKGRSLIGAWCFLDSYGPDRVAATGGMKVPRHPHTGLATVSWLFEGRIDHVDSAGNWATVRPGEVDLMNAGRGITHSEFSTRDTSVLHGVQLWYAFPDESRFGEPSLDTHRPEPVAGPGYRACVFLGSLLGVESPVATRIPLTGAELRIEPRTTVEIDVPPEHEHGVLRVDAPLSLDGVEIPRHGIGFAGTDSPLAPERTGVPVGGAELDELRGTAYDDGRPCPQFGTFPPGQPDPLPAPELPNTVLRARG